jgi:uncharacterized protein (DUF427 family)
VGEADPGAGQHREPFGEGSLHAFGATSILVGRGGEEHGEEVDIEAPRDRVAAGDAAVEVGAVQLRSELLGQQIRRRGGHALVLGLQVRQVGLRADIALGVETIEVHLMIVAVPAMPRSAAGEPGRAEWTNAAATPNGRRPVTDALEDHDLKAVVRHRPSSDHPVRTEPSPRRVRAFLDGTAVADSTWPWLPFETGLPTRYYLPKADVRMELLEATDRETQCPYKGTARYWSARVGDRVEEDLAWSYPFPIPECPKIEGLVAFYNERADIWVDGELQPKPATPWSRPPAR